MRTVLATSSHTMVMLLRWALYYLRVPLLLAVVSRGIDGFPYSGVKLYDYAVSGAVCSNKMIYRYIASINQPFPDVLGYEAPAFVADAHYVNASTGTNTLFTDKRPDNSVYSMWIGTNDLGVGALLTDNQTPGTNITTFTECVFQAFDLIYAAGARYFVLMNTAVHQPNTFRNENLC
jgi:hypothetical protein